MGLLKRIQEKNNQTGGGLKKVSSSGGSLSSTPKLKMITPFHAFGPIKSLLLDSDVTEVLVNGPNEVYCERNGKILLTSTQFRNNEHLISVIKKIGTTFGRKIDENSPMIDFTLPDEGQVRAMIPPLVSYGPMITITKNSKKLSDIN
ncbi:ATPase, T2SS/T4P/T4SS family [Neobacillus bataviensis]|uniref:ATPase, T2SS/T4P/T4SS family n=1 Tax=Neobacillus bataviensis TaxID=220685 RepID=UPI001CBC83A5|nr:ATPase, T2SS/T4P/T4SS family [Neobacillus bataviensis]